MSNDSSNPLGFGAGHPRLDASGAGRVEDVVPQGALRSVLGFTGHSIDDVVNSPVAKNCVRGYFKLYTWVHRGIEVNELERQWNPLEP